MGCAYMHGKGGGNFETSNGLIFKKLGEVRLLLIKKMSVDYMKFLSVMLFNFWICADEGTPPPKHSQELEATFL